VILVAGLTPAWQQILVFDRLRPGQINRAQDVHWCTSGKVFNAGIAVHHLGAASLTLAPAGGPPFSEMRAELTELGVPHRLVRTEAATRVCTTTVDRSTDEITELVEDGRPLAPSELRQFCDVYAEEAAGADVSVVIGSLPEGTPPSFYRELVERTPCPAVLDFRGTGLMLVLDLKPHVVKPNREELAATVGKSLDTDAALVEAMRLLNRRGAQWVVITQGSRPVWLSSQTKLYRLYPPRVDRVVNPIACGDAMAAGIAWATREGCDTVEAVRLGIGAATGNLGELLPCRLDPVDVRNWADAVQVEEVVQPA
jgi:1-phosphofructokinase family hexose kinase